MQTWSIGEVARRAGLQPSALRYYERVGVLSAPERVSGRRRYDSTVFQRLAMIRVAQQAGFSIAEIATLLGGFGEDAPPSARWHALAAPKLHAVDALLARVLGMRQTLEAGLRCHCARIEDCELCVSGDGV